MENLFFAIQLNELRKMNKFVDFRRGLYEKWLTVELSTIFIKLSLSNQVVRVNFILNQILLSVHSSNFVWFLVSCRMSVLTETQKGASSNRGGAKVLLSQQSLITNKFNYNGTRSCNQWQKIPNLTTKVIHVICFHLNCLFDLLSNNMLFQYLSLTEILCKISKDQHKINVPVHCSSENQLSCTITRVWFQLYKRVKVIQSR